MSVSIESVETVRVFDDTPDLSYLDSDSGRYDDVDAAERAKYEAADRERLEAYMRGDWHCVGVMARAKLRGSTAAGGWLQTISSPGIWGVESDSDETYFQELAADELETLGGMLVELGIDREVVERELEGAGGVPAEMV